MAKVKPSDLSENNKFTVAWLDSSVNSSDENQATQQKLCDTFGTVKIFDDEISCRQYIQSKPKQPITLIVSGRLSRNIVPDINELEQILGIYIYCLDKTRHEQWAEDFSKIKGIVVEVDELISRIQSDHETLPGKKEPTEKIIPSPGVKKTSPLDGYEKMPLVSLEQATAPLADLVADIDQMVWIVVQNCENPQDGLTKDQSAAVMLYTMEWYPKEKAFYYILNEALRSEKHHQIKPWLSYLKLVFSALAKLPSINHVVYRGVNSDISDSYSKGSTFVSWEFLTCTTSMKSLENEETFGKTGERTLFTIQCRSGKDIKAHSLEESKDQILLLPGRHFQIVSCLNAGDNLNIIQMDEMKSSYSFE